MVRICVIGAGVVGLSTATLLQEAFPGASVTIIADNFLQDTVSDGSGGYFLPGKQLQGPNDEITKKWVADSYKYYKGILHSAYAEEAGVKVVSGYTSLSKSPTLEKLELVELVVDVYRPCTEEELHQYGFKSGMFVTTMVMECRRYLPFLTKKFQKRGGKMIKRHLESLGELAGDFDVVCNCSGIGAKALCGDKLMAPLRGQVFKVRAPWIKHFFFVSSDTYILPGFELITVGGTKQLDNSNTNVCKYDSAGIWERATNFLPSLKEAEVVREWVGLRPYRPIIRVEKEILRFDSGKTLKVVHNYGHGAYGVMTSPGTSMHAVSLVKDFLNPTSSSSRL